MRAQKEGKYLVFYFDDERNSTVKYDLSNGQCIGKSGRPVKDIKTQLRGHSIKHVIDMFEDERYKKFLTAVNKEINLSSKKTSFGYRATCVVQKITNVGSFLEKIKEYPNAEQYYSAGIENVNINIKTKITDVPKGLIKLIRNNPDWILTDYLVESYNNNISKINFLNELYSKGDPFNCFTKKQVYQYALVVNNLSSEEQYRPNRSFRLEYYMMNELISTYGYTFKGVLNYIDYLVTYEALYNQEEAIREIYDYAKMASRISNKYDKYPRNFLTTFRITTRNYNRLKETFDEQDFKKIKDHNYKNMEWEYGNYVFLYPENTQAIKDEAVQQSNCVASYINRVLKGDCHILFMRDKNNKDKSLVIVEVSNHNNKIVQALQSYNRPLNDSQREAVEKWNDHYKRTLERKENVA